MQTSMNISLPGSLKSWVEKQVRRKGYSTASEYVRDLLRREQELESAVRAQVDEQLLAGQDSGSAEPMNDKGWLQVRREGRRRATSRKPA
jgi:antitoxin ParD1/3/4